MRLRWGSGRRQAGAVRSRPSARFGIGRRLDRFAGEWAGRKPPSAIPSANWKRLGRWRPGRWKSKRPVATSVLVPLLTVFFFLVTGLALVAGYELLWGDGDLLGLDAKCKMADRSCGLLTSLALSLYPISAAVFWIFIVRLDRVRKNYRKEAWKHPDQLLETDIPSAQIVGRDDLCEVLQKDLARSSEDETGVMYQRPVILVGGVGIGKTAVLARLTQLLAERGAVPVPIRLRAAQNEKLDLHDLARKKFLGMAPVLSDAEADKIWRRLKANKQVVIVADGLEEALMSVTDTRETALRVAIRDVRRHGVALIVSSRPHEALAYLDAALVTLEPLEPHAAFEYITDVDASADHVDRAARIVHRAEVAEMPLFMHYARQLVESGALDSSLDVRDVGRLGMRVRLLDRWMEVLQEGRIQRDVPVTPERRRKVVAELQSFAAVALVRDSLEVTFDDIKELAMEASDGSGDGASGAGGDRPRPKRQAAEHNGSKRPDPLKQALGATTEGLREIAADADRLGLADAQPDGLRFRHSVMQAYLGSRAITDVLGAEANSASRRKLSELLNQGLTKPGRELLMALAMSCTVHGDHVRTRAIGLLLRNVEREGAKAVNTASAVIAAASASAEQGLPEIVPTVDWAGAAHAHIGDFREGVVLWLKRAERQDAEREAQRAFEAVEEAQRRSATAESEEYQRRLALHDTEEVEASLTAVVGDEALDGVTASSNSARLIQAQQARKQAEADLAAARAETDASKSGVARAWAEVGVAKTILAQRFLAEADGEAASETRQDLRGRAVSSLGAARSAADQAAEVRREAAHNQDPVSLRNLDAGALSEFFVSCVALAQAALAEGQAEAKRKEEADAERKAKAERAAEDAPDAPDVLDDEEVEDAPRPDFEQIAVERLDEVIDTAGTSVLMRRAAGFPAGHDARAAEPLDVAGFAGKVRAATHEAETLINDAGAETDVVAAREFLIAARRKLGAETDPDLFDRRLWDRETARARVTTLRLASLALASAAEAKKRIAKMGAEDNTPGDVALLRKRAIVSLGGVSKSLEVKAEAKDVLKVERREATPQILALAALAEVKATAAQHRLEAPASGAAGPVSQSAYDDAARSLRKVVERADSTRLADADAAPGERVPHRATSRKQVLVPLKRTTREHDVHADEGVQSSKLDAIARLADAYQFAWLWDVCKAEPDYLIRLAAARRLGGGGWVAFRVLRSDLEAIEAVAMDREGPPSRNDARKQLNDAQLGDLTPDRAFELLGLLLPLLYASIEREADHDATQEREERRGGGDAGDTTTRRPTAHADMLQRWVKRVGDGMFITSETALAQGFRLAANERGLAPGQRGVLAARARELLHKTNFWFTRVALAQALTLWLIADTAAKRGKDDSYASDREAVGKIYQCWDPGGHPLVAEAIELCAKAFRRRQPENYIWLDEGWATAKLGAGPKAVHRAGSDDEWIPASAGWLSLAPRAQRLLGDIVVFLNLADRGDQPETREDLLGKTKRDPDREPHKQIWPPCMEHPSVRYRLHVSRNIDERAEPSTECAPECDVGLCPYPGLGEDLSRGELTEAFCRRQQEVVGPRELKHFWRDMERRPRA
jgi:hypothetical protein